MDRPLRVLYLEPFEAGSHAVFGRALRQHAGSAVEWTSLTLPGRHWKWRMRGSALWFAERHAAELRAAYDALLCSSFTPLAELVGLVPSLAQLPRVLYFHENQWEYPVREDRERDHHFGFTQLVSAAAADRCLFNSAFNRDSFLAQSRQVLQRMPDARPMEAVERIASRSSVVGFPVPLAERTAPVADVSPGPDRARGPHLLWNHRWEHDKDPEAFFAAAATLRERDVPFRLLVCGESYSRRPPAFDRARKDLADRIVQFGTLADVEDYRATLDLAQVAVSTARHEFFGVASVEAVHHGAQPLVPDRLAYPEWVPAAHRYADQAELVSELERLCRGWTAGAIDLRVDRSALVARHRAERVVPRLLEEIVATVQSRPR